MILRGEIYFVDLNPVKGREQSGRRLGFSFVNWLDKQIAAGCYGCGWYKKRKYQERFSNKR